MSSSILHDKIHHSILFPNQPFFFHPPYFIGFVCFAHILTHSQDNLSTKATKCVFLCYSRLQRGYHCHSPDTHRYFVSVNVTFFENSSMFPITQPPNSNQCLKCQDILTIYRVSVDPDTILSFDNHLIKKSRKIKQYCQ